MEWFSRKTSIAGIQNFKLDDRFGRRHCNLAHLQLHALGRPSSNPAMFPFKTGRRTAAKLLTRDEARRIAVSVATLPGFRRSCAR